MLRIVIVTVTIPVATVIIVGKHIIVTAGIIITLIVKDIVTVIVIVVIVTVIVVVVKDIPTSNITSNIIVVVVKYVIATVIHRQLGGIVFLLISILHKLFIEQLNIFDSYLIGFAQTIENEG